MLEEQSKGTFYGRVALLGTGLIGGSLGIRLRERRLVKEVIGYDRDPDSLRLARERGAIDRAAPSLEEAVRGARLIILAVPVLSMTALVEQVRPALQMGAVISDVGVLGQGGIPVKFPYTAGNIFHRGTSYGRSEEAGISHADPAMLENAIYATLPAIPWRR